MGHIQVGAHGALAFAEVGDQGGVGGVFHEGYQIWGGKDRDQAGAHRQSGVFRGDHRLAAALEADFNGHGEFLLCVVWTQCT